MSEKLTIREACRRRKWLSGTDAQALEHALTQSENETKELLTALRFWFPDKEDSRARSFPGEWERDAKLLERLK